MQTLFVGNGFTCRLLKYKNVIYEIRMGGEGDYPRLLFLLLLSNSDNLRVDTEQICGKYVKC